MVASLGALSLVLLLGISIGSPVALYEISQRQRELRHDLYVAKMSLAQQAWDENNVDRLRQLLAETQVSPDRGFEWGFWQPQTHLALRSVRAHAGGIWTMALSADGPRVATGAADSTAKVWNVTTQGELLTLNHGTWVRAISFSPG